MNVVRDNDIRHTLAQLSYDLAGLLRAAVAIHGLEYAVVRVLKRQVYIVEHLGLRGHGVYKLVGYLIGIAIEQAYPLYAVDSAEQIQKMGESVFAVEINAVGRDILRYEHKLLTPCSARVFASSTMLSSPRLWKAPRIDGIAQ